MKKCVYAIAIALFCLSLSGCSGCSSKQEDTSWYDAPNEEEYTDSVNGGKYEPPKKQDDTQALEHPVDAEIPVGVSLQEAGRSVYTDLLALEERYNFGGVKLCAEMSADQAGKPYSSFTSPVNITFLPPAELHLHQINVTDSSSNIICRIANGEIDVVLGNVDNKFFHQPEDPAFAIPIEISNRKADTLVVTLPRGQMLEVQAPHVQNIVVHNTTIIHLAPNQTRTIATSAYCGAEKRDNPTGHSVRLTPFILTAPLWAYRTQQDLWSFQKTRPANDKYYTITFYAWRIGTHVGDDDNAHKSSTGHAFVDIPEIGVVGYGGTVTDHAKYIQYADYKVSIKIDEPSLRKVQQKYWEWKNNPPEYELAKYDCTTFAMDIADAAGIYYGPRFLIQFPAGFLRELQTYN